jgi:hypothetical protein
MKEKKIKNRIIKTKIRTKKKFIKKFIIKSHELFELLQHSCEFIQVIFSILIPDVDKQSKKGIRLFNESLNL